MITNLIATVGENMRLRRAAHFSVAAGPWPSMCTTRPRPASAASAFWSRWKARATRRRCPTSAASIAMHVAATAPLSLSPDDLDQAAIEHEKAIFTEQALESGKPANVVEKMVEGRIRKFLEEVVLLKQAFVMNPDQTVEQLVAETAKTLGSPVKVRRLHAPGARRGRRQEGRRLRRRGRGAVDLILQTVAVAEEGPRVLTSPVRRRRGPRATRVGGWGIRRFRIKLRGCNPSSSRGLRPRAPPLPLGAVFSFRRG